MPWVEFLKDYLPYKKGQKVDLPGRLTWKLKAEKVVVRIEPPGARRESDAGRKKATALPRPAGKPGKK